MNKTYDFSDFENKELDFSDFDKSGESEKDSLSLLEQGLIKVTEGASFGFLDELAGATEAAGRVAGVKGLGKAFGEQELSKPTLKISDLLSAYEEARNTERQQSKAISKESPILSTTAEIAGGLTTGLVPVGMAAQAAKVAPLAASIATGGVTGAVTGAGYSEAENVQDLLKDIGSGLQTGVAFGTAVPVAGKVVSSVGKKIGDVLGKADDVITGGAIQKGFQRGYDQGVSLFSPKFKESVGVKQGELVGQVSDDLGKMGKQLEDIEFSNKAAVAGKELELGQDIKQLKNQRSLFIDDIIDKSNADIDKIKQNAETLNVLKKSNLNESNARQVNVLANKVQQNLDDRLSFIGKGYDKIDERLKDSSVTFNFNDEIASFGEKADNVDITISDEIKKNFNKYFEQAELNLDQKKNLLASIDNQLKMSMSNPERRAFYPILKEFRQSIKAKEFDTISNSGLAEEAADLKRLNQEYGKIVQLKDLVEVDPLTKDFAYDKQLTGAIKKFQNLDELDVLSETAEFSNRLKTALPEKQVDVLEPIAAKLPQVSGNKVSGTDLVEEMKTLGKSMDLAKKIDIKKLNPSDQEAVNNIKNRIDNLKNVKSGKINITQPEINAIDNEIARLDQQLKQIPSVKDQIKLEAKDTFEKMMLNPDKTARDQQLLGLMKQYTDEYAKNSRKFGMEYERGSKSAEMKEVIEKYKFMTGRDIEQDVKELAEDLSLLDTDIMGMFGSITFLRTAAAYPASLVGSYAKKVSNVIAPLDKAISRLGENSALSKTLMDVKNMPDGDAKTQKLFLLGQQPWYRNLIKEDVEKQDEE